MRNATMKLRSLCVALALLGCLQSIASAGMLHEDTKEVKITEGLNGTWKTTSLLNFVTDHPHETPVGGIVKFNSTNIFTGSASLYTPLFLPGDLVGGGQPTAGSDLDNSGVYRTNWNLTGPGVFDYTLPWTIRYEPNRSVFAVAEAKFSANVEPELTVGEASVSVGGFGAEVTIKPTGNTAAAFESIGLAKEFYILSTPLSDGSGFFASGGRIVLDGWVRDTAPGTSTLLFENTIWLSGEGPLVDDFTRANNPGKLTIGVFDVNTSVVPEPSSLMLAALGLASFGGIAWRKERKAKQAAV